MKLFTLANFLKSRKSGISISRFPSLSIVNKKFSISQNFANSPLSDSYLQNFKSIYNFKWHNIDLIDLIQSQEFLKANYLIYTQDYGEAESIFEKIKEFIRQGDLVSRNYCVVLRRLGICKLKQFKINEGLLEMENVYEYSKEKSVFDHKFRFNAMMELLKSYILYDSSRAGYFANKLEKDKKIIKSLEYEELSEYYHQIALAYFASNSKPFEEIKTILRKAINYTQNIFFKANILHNLSIVLYYEIKSHNKYIDFATKMDNESKRRKDTFLSKRQELIQSQISDEDRIKRRLSKKEQEQLEEEKKKLDEIKFSHIASQDAYIKKSLRMFTEEYTKKEKLFLELAREFEKNPDKIISQNGDYDFGIMEESLLNSKLPKDEKVHALLYNVENYDINEQIDKVLKSLVEYEIDLNSILPNLFIAIKLRELFYFQYALGNTESHPYNLVKEKFKDNYSSEMKLENFVMLYPPLFEVLTKKNIKFETFIKSIREYKNMMSEMTNPDQVSEFKDIIDKDKFFTYIKDTTDQATVMFLAEVFIENSKDFSEESLYWIKYAFSLAYLTKDENAILRCLSLSAAAIIDSEDSNLTLAEMILQYIHKLYKTETNKNKHYDPTTFTMVTHLLGILIKTRPKEKGEGLELIEMAKKMRKYQTAEERVFFLNFNKNYSFEIDYDEKTLNYIDNMNKNSQS